MPRNITLAVNLPGSPDRLYEMFLDPRAHAAFTGAPVTIEPRPGAPFRAFNGALWGTVLYVEPKRLIVLKWRSVNFPQDAIDSVLVLSFWPAGVGAGGGDGGDEGEGEGGGRIELTHVNVPEEDFAGVSEGWTKYYWNPWRAFLTDPQSGG